MTFVILKASLAKSVSGDLHIPALLHTISRRPNFLTALLISSTTSPYLETSHLKNTASHPFLFKSSIVGSSILSSYPNLLASIFISVTTSLAPSFASSSATALPIPELEPVTIATLPLNLSILAPL